MRSSPKTSPNSLTKPRRIAAAHSRHLDQRDAGEGRAITVRASARSSRGSASTGWKRSATSTDGASSNRDRAFDFNVFASELFNSIVVHKNRRGEPGRRVAGAVVDLTPAIPLGGKTGFTGVLSGQASYNDLSKNWGPRSPGCCRTRTTRALRCVGVGGLSEDQQFELGNNTTRWAQGVFDSVNGTPCFSAPNRGGTYTAAAGSACDQVALAFHPRIPR